MIIWVRINKRSLLKNHTISIAQMTDCSYGGRGHVGTITFLFKFRVNGKEIEGGGSFNSSELNFGDLQSFFLGKTFPVIYNPDYPHNNFLLIRPGDFKQFDYSFPDTLQWVLKYLHSDKPDVSNKNALSRVVKFQYLGYGDTIYALMEGNVYINDSINTSDTLLKPLAGVQVNAEQNNKLTYTNSNGEFMIGLEKGTFNLMITREGYQPLKITNYMSDPDQVSRVKIILAKGDELKTFEIPKPLR
jgi:Carboxypeptidase regulatory-like domain